MNNLWGPLRYGVGEKHKPLTMQDSERGYEEMVIIVDLEHGLHRLGQASRKLTIAGSRSV
jgi:hypothetical protein